jgi:hypothetical protein
MSKFKVGNKVRALVSTKWWRKGDVGIFRKINGSGGFRVDFEGGDPWGFCDDEESSFELVEPKVHITGGGGSGGNKLFHALKKDCIGEIPKHLSFGCVMNPTIKEYPNPPHKHKDLIIAWANGADIEFDGTDDGWYNVKYPSWDDTLEYRIKSTKTPLQIEIEKCEAKLVKLKGQL